MVLDNYFENKSKDIMFLPISINYEKYVEEDFHLQEFTNENKKKPSLNKFLQVFFGKVLGNSFGRIIVQFADPIFLSQFLNNFKIENSLADPFQNLNDRKQLTEKLAYKVLNDFNKQSVIVATSIVSSILLSNKDGCTVKEICFLYDRVSQLILDRGFRVDNFYNKQPTRSIVDRALKLLGLETFNIKHNIVQIKLDQQKDFVNLTKLGTNSFFYYVFVSFYFYLLSFIFYLSLFFSSLFLFFFSLFFFLLFSLLFIFLFFFIILGIYRNQLVNIFFLESVVLCSFHSLTRDEEEQLECSVRINDLIEKSQFLFNLLSLEFQIDENPNFFPDFHQIVQKMEDRKIISVDNQKVSINDYKDYLFFTSLLFPYIDAYWVSSVALNSLLGRNVKESNFLSTSVWLMEKFFVENVICFYDCCSLDIMKNSLKHFEKNEIVVFSSDEIKLSPTMHFESNLSHFNTKINQYRKIPFHKFSKKKGEVSQYPLFVSKI
jgi:glyceronephosphate O-acyltransferase